LLETKIKHSWVDPRGATSVEDFFYKYVTAWGFSNAADEILKMVTEYVATADMLEKKEKGELTSKFNIGG